MYQKILVPFDGSEAAEKAAIHAAELASRTGSEIILFHVVTALPKYLNESTAAIQPVIDALFRQGNEMLAKIKNEIAQYNLNISTEISIGQPAGEICKKVEETGCGLVVMGSRGLGEIKSYLMGSVSSHVTRHANCPVLIVR